MTFGEAIVEMKNGKRCARAGWNGKNMWIRYVDLYTDAEFRIQPQPQAKESWLPFLIMKTADGALVPWLASQTDMLAEDWSVVS